MPNLFGLDIAGIIAQNMGRGLRPGVLTSFTPGTRTTGSLGGGNNPTSTTHTFRGFKDTTSVLRPGTLVENASAVITILGGTISPAVKPDEGDTIVLDDESFVIVGPVVADPAEATFICQVG